MRKNESKIGFYGRLRDIAWDLNQLRDRHPAGMKSWTDAWKSAESIVQSVAGDVPAEPGDTLLGRGNQLPDLEWGMALFNKTFTRLPVRLAIALPKNRTHPMPVILPMSKTKDPLVLLGIRLWFDYFNNPNRDRLKQCWRCKAWFVDRTKNGLKHFCTPRCSQRWWTRPFRREWVKLRERQRTGKQSRQTPLTREDAVAVLTRLKAIKTKKKQAPFQARIYQRP